MMPKFVWNTIAVFFSLWAGVAGWLLLGGDTSPVVRLALVICGAISVYAGSVGRLLNGVKVRRPAFRLSGWSIGLLVILGFLGASFAYFAYAFNENYADYFAASAMKEQGISLLKHAEENGDTLPSDMRSATISRYFPMRYRVSERRKLRGEPFVWNSELAGLRTKDFAEPDKVILAYSQKISDHNDYVILYLDGHYRKRISWERLHMQMRVTAAAIVAAKQAKAKRDAVH